MKSEAIRPCTTTGGGRVRSVPQSAERPAATRAPSPDRIATPATENARSLHEAAVPRAPGAATAVPKTRNVRFSEAEPTILPVVGGGPTRTTRRAKYATERPASRSLDEEEIDARSYRTDAGDPAQIDAHGRAQALSRAMREGRPIADGAHETSFPPVHEEGVKPRVSINMARNTTQEIDNLLEGERRVGYPAEMPSRARASIDPAEIARREAHAKNAATWARTVSTEREPNGTLSDAALVAEKYKRDLALPGEPRTIARAAKIASRTLTQDDLALLRSMQPIHDAREILAARNDERMAEAEASAVAKRTKSSPLP